MTKKFFRDWQNKWSLTKKIILNISSFEEKNKIYYFYDHCLLIDTLFFEKEYISIVVKTHWYSLDNLTDGFKDKRIKIHRKDIKTVEFYHNGNKIR